MEKISGIVYERGKSHVYGMLAFFIAVICFLIGLMTLGYADHLQIVVFITLFTVILLILTIFSMVHFFKNVKIDFITDSKILSIQIIKSSQIECIDVIDYKFSIVACNSVYYRDIRRLLVELAIKTNKGIFVITEDLKEGTNPGFTIRSMPYGFWYIERFFVRSQGTLLELAKKMGQLSQ